VNVNVNATTTDSQGNPLTTDSDSWFDFAVDFSPFVTDGTLGAATSLANASASGSQDSEFLPQGAHAAGSAYAATTAAPWSTASASVTSTGNMTFTLAAPDADQYTLTFRTSRSAFSLNTGNVSASGSYDITVLFTGGAVDAPVVAGSTEGPRAWPNPFRAETSIRTALPADVPLQADVFDAAGRLVQTLPTHRSDVLVWDGRAVPDGACPRERTS
jgi:hypothetical protein